MSDSLVEPGQLAVRGRPAWQLAFAGALWALWAGAAAGVNPAYGVLVVLAPVGLWALLGSATLRLLIVVVGGLLVFGSSDGVGVQKAAYLVLLLLCALISAINLVVDPPASARAFLPAIPIGVVFVIGLVLSTLSGPSVSPVTAVRQSLFYLMIPMAPIVGIDAGRRFDPRHIRAIVGVIGTLAAVSYSIDWMARRGVYQAPLDKFMASSFVVCAMAWALAVVCVANAQTIRSRVLWSLALLVIPVALILPGTRTNLVIFVAPLAMIGSRLRRRVPGAVLVAIFASMLGVVAIVLPIVASALASDPTFLEKRLNMLLNVFKDGAASDQSGAMRLQQYDYAWSHTLQSPVFGLGPGYASDVILDTPLTVPMRIGFFGAIVLLAFLATLVRSSIRCTRDIGGSVFSTAAGGIALVVVCLVPFGTVIEDRGFAIMLALLLAGVVSTHSEPRPVRALNAEQRQTARSF